MKRFALFLTALIFVFATQLKAQVDANDETIPDTVNKTDSFGKKTGFWIEKTGGMVYKGEYVDNKKVKSWIGYYPTNFIYKVELYTNGVKDGISMQFDKHGKITLVENYKNGLLHGKTINYGGFSETPMAETDYLNGKRNGLYRLYYDNAKIQEESWFKNDLKDGLSRWNNKNGRKMAEYNYKAGNFDGVQKTFYENDSLQTTETYLENKLSGEYREYYRNGKVKVSGKYVNGQKEGAWTEYDELGKIVKVTKFKDGQEAKKK